MSRFFPKTLLTALVGSLVGATAMTPSAIAQTAQSYVGLNQYCDALATLPDERSDELRTQWVTQARVTAEAGDEAQCRIWYDDAIAALDNQGETSATAAARIRVTQPDPQVDVRQRAPLISVTDPEPSVRVNQGQPEIIVRQAAPQVRVQIPQPIITIDQPQPEIIVRMPEPDIAVTNPEPQVEVRMREPVINVEQPEPQVSVQGGQGSESSPDISLQQQEPEVQIQSNPNAAQIDVQREEPSIRYEQAEPNIQVDPQGEPDIRFSQSGEPNIRFEQAGDGVDGQDAGMAILMLQPGDDTAMGQPRPYNVTDIEGRSIANQRGQQVGDVDRLVRGADQCVYVVLTDGRTLGYGEDQVALPLDAMAVVNGELVLIGMEQADIAGIADFDTQGATNVGTTERVNIGTR